MQKLSLVMLLLLTGGMAGCGGSASQPDPAVRNQPAELNQVEDRTQSAGILEETERFTSRAAEAAGEVVETREASNPAGTELRAAATDVRQIEAPPVPKPALKTATPEAPRVPAAVKAEAPAAAESEDESPEFAFPEPPVARPVPEPEPVVVPSPPRRQQASIAVNQTVQPSAPEVASQPQPVILVEGTVLAIRLQEGLSSEHNRSGDRFLGILDEDVLANGKVILAKGSEIEGSIVRVIEPGKVKGRASMGLVLSGIRVGDQVHPIRTNEIVLEAESSKGRDARAVGAATAIGAAIGAIFGGGKGAAVGAASGAGAGTAGVLLSRGQPVRIEKERLFSFRLEETLEFSGS